MKSSARVVTAVHVELDLEEAEAQTVVRALIWLASEAPGLAGSEVVLCQTMSRQIEEALRDAREEPF